MERRRAVRECIDVTFVPAAHSVVLQARLLLSSVVVICASVSILKIKPNENVSLTTNKIRALLDARIT